MLQKISHFPNNNYIQIGPPPVYHLCIYQNTPTTDLHKS